MRYLIKIDRLDEKNLFFENQINRINERVDELQKLANNIDWVGPAREAFVEYFNNYINDLNKVKKQMLNCLLFCKTYSKNYSSEYDRIKLTFNNILDEMEKKDEYSKMQFR